MSENRTKIMTYEVPDPFAGFSGKPMFSGGGPTATYVGRVVIELWESPNMTDEQTMAITTDTTGSVDWKTLLQRVAAALPARIAHSPSSQ